MGSPLGPILPDIFMIELKKSLLTDTYILHIKFWTWYVDATISYVKTGFIQHISSLFKSFNKKRQFTFETVNEGTLSFSEMLSCRNGAEVTKAVYRKKTNNDSYLN